LWTLFYQTEIPNPNNTHDKTENLFSKHRYKGTFLSKGKAPPDPAEGLMLDSPLLAVLQPASVTV